MSQNFINYDSGYQNLSAVPSMNIQPLVNSHDFGAFSPKVGQHPQLSKRKQSSKPTIPNIGSSPFFSSFMDSTGIETSLEMNPGTLVGSMSNMNISSQQPKLGGAPGLSNVGQSHMMGSSGGMLMTGQVQTAPNGLQSVPLLDENVMNLAMASHFQEDLLGQISGSILLHLDLDNFKTSPCPLKKVHSHKKCPFYHNEKDKRRPGNNYNSDLCKFIEKGQKCPQGNNCKFCHNKVEQLYKPEKYKTKFCSNYPNNLDKCEYGAFCSFGHSERDIVITLIHNFLQDEDFFLFHYKTVWCPFNYINHDKGACVYAHNWQDFRRDPRKLNLEPVPCPSWNPTEHISNYDKACPQGFNCNKCHGWKEYDFHPLIYRTKQCQNNKKCNKGKVCSNYHTNEEKRTINQIMFNKIFKFAPRNRITEDSFIKEEIIHRDEQSPNSFQSVPKPVGSFPVKSSQDPSQQADTKIQETVYNSILNTMNAYPSYEDIMFESNENQLFEREWKSEPNFPPNNVLASKAGLISYYKGENRGRNDYDIHNDNMMKKIIEDSDNEFDTIDEDGPIKRKSGNKIRHDFNEQKHQYGHSSSYVNHHH